MNTLLKLYKQDTGRSVSVTDGTTIAVIFPLYLHSVAVRPTRDMIWVRKILFDLYVNLFYAICE